MTLLSIALANLAAGQTAVSPHGELIPPISGSPSPAAQDYSPAPYSDEVAALVDLVNAGDVEDALDLVLVEDTRFTPTAGCFDTGASLYASLLAWGYEVVRDPFYTTLVFSDADSAGGDLCAVGQAGLIYTSSDGGFTWTRRDDGSVPASLYETAYAADDPAKVSAAGSSGVLLQSDDGGETWTAFDLPGEEGLTVTALARPTTDVIYIAGYTPDGMAALKSVDGGASWNYLSHGFPAGAVCFGMFFLDEDTGWLCGGTTGSPYQTCISRTADGGETWELWSASGPLAVNLSFADAETGFAVGNDYETIFRTTDGGAAWETVHSFDGPDYEYLGDVEVLSATDAVAVGYGGCVLATDDGGDTWVYLREASDDPDEGHRTSLVAVDSERWFATGYGAFELTDDGGIGWYNAIADLGLPPAVNLYAFKAGALGEPGPLVIAPYDCTSENPWRDAPGADANGSGVAAALVAAKALGALETERNLSFLFTATRYSGGDLGQSGARRFLAENPSLDFRAILDLEAVGYANDANLDLLLTGNVPGEELTDAVYGYASDYVPDLPLYRTTNGFDFGHDHGAFWDAGFLAVLLEEYYPEEDERNFNIGTVHDTRDTLSPGQMLHAARLATAFAAAEALFADEVALVPRDPYVFPNPFRPGRGHEGVTFAGMPAGGLIRVYDIAGSLVYEGTANEGPYIADGLATWRHTWDATNSGGVPLAGGVYIYYAQGPRGNAVGKLAIIP
ncbi:MAG: hypothetical protein A2Y64_07890 [Candidatus Coatesbacteria bacterium RBG_13_66_14]|uniref:Peptidase M28 domain-containing protein n=1 Tax=Candidatus Coatesbacteria bacterium RBG_13_66_14 TaxID=1817816 RepID=A0A1F5FIR5_9BACT|nr:MAG: hypothetical protein A2Y64_07890 [Candidatus Coatesbacteria bacterium RBG_13_66_14]